jgi:hypothetical protein
MRKGWTPPGVAVIFSGSACEGQKDGSYTGLTIAYVCNGPTSPYLRR